MKNDFQTGKAAGLIRINQTFIFKEIHIYEVCDDSREALQHLQDVLIIKCTKSLRNRRF